MTERTTASPPTSPATKETTVVLKYLDEGKPKAPSFNNNISSGMVGGVRGGTMPYPDVETTSKATSVAPNAKTPTSERPEVQSWTKVFTRRTFLNDLKVLHVVDGFIGMGI